MEHQTLILIPAAGASSRMQGIDKLMEPLDGHPLILRQARIALATGAPLLVTLPEDRPARASALAGLPLQTRIVPDADEGMAASIRTGAALAGSGALMVLPADMPDITTADLTLILHRHKEMPDRILRATAEDGTQGHPVLFPAKFLTELSTLSGDTGGREIIARHMNEVELIALPGRHAVTDLDTPEDWAAWRASRP